MVEVIASMDEEFQEVQIPDDSIDDAIVNVSIPEDISPVTPNAESFFVNLHYEEDIRECEEKLQEDLEELIGE